LKDSGARTDGTLNSGVLARASQRSPIIRVDVTSVFHARGSSRTDSTLVGRRVAIFSHW